MTPSRLRPARSAVLHEALDRAGLGRLLARTYGGRGSVLMFHRIGQPGPELTMPANRRNFVSAAQFERVLDTLAAAGIATLGLDGALQRLGMDAPGRFACLTFDDGYRDNLEQLLPIVRARGIPVTVYIAPGLIDGTAPLWWYGLDMAIARERRVRLPLGAPTPIQTGSPIQKQAGFARVVRFMLQAGPGPARAVADALARDYGIDFAQLARLHMLTWDMARELAACPLVEIGAHTLTHPSLARLDPPAARAEMDASRARLEAELGRHVRHFAYPFGERPSCGKREAALAAELGFRTAVTANSGNLFPAHRAAPHALPRIGIGPDDGQASIRLKLSGVTAARRNPLRPVVM